MQFSGNNGYFFNFRMLNENGGSGDHHYYSHQSHPPLVHHHLHHYSIPPTTPHSIHLSIGVRKNINIANCERNIIFLLNFLASSA